MPERSRGKFRGWELVQGLELKGVLFGSEGPCNDQGATGQNVATYNNGRGAQRTGPDPAAPV